MCTLCLVDFFFEIGWNNDQLLPNGKFNSVAFKSFISLFFSSCAILERLTFLGKKEAFQQSSINRWLPVWNRDVGHGPALCFRSARSIFCLLLFFPSINLTIFLSFSLWFPLLIAVGPCIKQEILRNDCLLHDSIRCLQSWLCVGGRKWIGTRRVCL